MSEEKNKSSPSGSRSFLTCWFHWLYQKCLGTEAGGGGGGAGAGGTEVGGG